MAEAVLSPLVEVVVEGLTSAIQEEVGLICGVDEELDHLRSMLSHIRCLLADAEKRDVMDSAVKHWLAELKSVACDADDVIDEFAYEALGRKVKAERQTRNIQVCDFLLSGCCFMSQVPFRWNMAHRIKKINKDIARIKEFGENNLRLKEVGDRERPIPIPKPLPSSSVMAKDAESDVVGREKEIKQIVNLLVPSGTDTSCGGKDVSVICIVGMGGLGKTTLAQLVYNNETVKKHFEVRAWVCVSDNFDIVQLSKAIIESATRKRCDLSDIDALQRELEDTLSAKRFLLALDDVWNTDRGAWDKLRPPFSCGAKGSRIMVTTRDEEVANAMDTDDIRKPAFLSNADCWLLFKRHAFGRENADDFPELMKIGRKLVNSRCQGLPLAAKSLGTLLSSERDEGFWNLIMNSPIWNSSQIWSSDESQNEVMKALMVSYHHLPPRIKPCFAYCSIFPKDYVFDKERLVRLWMAEGFIIPEGGVLTLEDIGNKYFDFLLSRSFFQVKKYFDFVLTRPFYQVKQRSSLYIMHDCIHDLALSVSSGKGRRIEKEIAKLGDPSEFRRLRTFSIEGHSRQEFDNRVMNDLTIKYTCLRVLVLKSAPLTELPDSISNLKHLRYLDLSDTAITQLPESVNRLYNLQTLDLRNTWKLRQLPRDMMLVNLRHLYLEENYPSLKGMPPGMGRLTCLQTLPIFIVGEGKGYGGLQELKRLTELRGALRITELWDVLNAEEVEEAELKNKPKIETLILEGHTLRKANMNHPQGQAVVDEEESRKVLEALQPHTNIKDLSIVEYGGNNNPTWLQDTMLPKLESLTLMYWRCVCYKSLPPLGRFPMLRDLYIDGMPAGLKHMGLEFYGSVGEVKGNFPLLNNLHIADVPNLEEWCPVDDGEFPCLQDLRIEGCPKLMKMPNCFPALKCLVLSGCDQLTSLPNLPSINKLELDYCNAVLLTQICHLTSLSSLNISDFRELKSLPDEMLPSSLTALTISLCAKLMSLPKGLRSLSSLNELSIWSCPELHSMPEEGLPATVEILKIDNCLRLTERCKKEVGEDWAKISHIPRILIDRESKIRNDNVLFWNELIES